MLSNTTVVLIKCSSNSALVEWVNPVEPCNIILGAHIDNHHLDRIKPKGNKFASYASISTRRGASPTLMCHSRLLSTRLSFSFRVGLYPYSDTVALGAAAAVLAQAAVASCKLLLLSSFSRITRRGFVLKERSFLARLAGRALDFHSSKEGFLEEEAFAGEAVISKAQCEWHVVPFFKEPVAALSCFTPLMRLPNHRLRYPMRMAIARCWPAAGCSA